MVGCLSWEGGAKEWGGEGEDIVGPGMENGGKYEPKTNAWEQYFKRPHKNYDKRDRWASDNQRSSEPPKRPYY